MWRVSSPPSYLKKKKKKKNYAARLKFFMMFIRLFVLVMLSIWLAKHDGI